jgi:hypothetical protein
MSNLSNIPGGGDLPDRYRNVGEQIQAFFDFAENNPDRAVPFFVNIWQTQASLTTRALALQGLGVAAKHYHVKEALADWDVLRDIAKEVKGKGEVSNDLTRWAAASALEAIGYSQQSLQHLEGGGFTEPLDRIRREIRDRKLSEINKIKRLNSRGETTAEYERHLEFWLYGATQDLLTDKDTSRNYQDLVNDVIDQLHGRGVYLGLRSPNRIVQAAALRQARLIFKESAEIEKYIYELLEEFLDNLNHEISLRINAAEIIHTATDLNRKLKTLSKLLLEDTEWRNLAVRLLTPDKQELARVDRDAYMILDTFAFNYSLHQPELKDLTIAQLEAHISSTNQYQNKISSIFSSAINAAESLAGKHRKSASLLKKIFQNNQNEYLSNSENLIDQARYNINEMYTLKSKINSNQDLLRKIVVEQGSQIIDLDSLINSKFLTLIRDIYTQLDRWNNVECQTNNQYRILASELTSVKDELKDALISRKYDLENTKKETYTVTILVLFIISWFVSLFAINIYFRTIGGSGNTVLSVGMVIFLMTFFILLIPPIFILNSRNKKKQKIMEVLKYLTGNWQE